MTVFTVGLLEDMRVTTMVARSGETIRITGKALHIREPQGNVRPIVSVLYMERNMPEVIPD